MRTGQGALTIHNGARFTITIYFLAPSGAQERLMFVRPFVRPVQVCLELSLIIFLAQVSFGSLLQYYWLFLSALQLSYGQTEPKILRLVSLDLLFDDVLMFRWVVVESRPSIRGGVYTWTQAKVGNFMATSLHK